MCIIKKLMKYDFETGQYFDMQSKKNIDESQWEFQASHQVRTGILS